MPDALAERLSRLAPTVDVAAGRRLFEQARAGGTPPPYRRLAVAAAVVLLVAGVVGLAALTRDDPAGVPADEPNPTAPPPVDPETAEPPVATGDEFELLAVEEVVAPFHELRLATGDAELAAIWAELSPPVDAPEVDFVRHVVAVFTRPDNACPDTLEGFDVVGETWTPRFSTETGACNDPLLTWLYAVELERAALGSSVTVDLPADELYDAPAASASAPLGQLPDDPSGSDEPPPTLTELDVTVPLPDVGRPTLHATTVGAVWAVRHHDGSVSVLPALVDVPASADEGGVRGIARLVVPNADGTQFRGPRWSWDAWGRTIGGPRSEDLAGFIGEVRGDEIALLASSAERVEGEPSVPPSASPEFPSAADAAAAHLEPIDLGTYFTLSYRGPAVRLMDVTLVVEDGVGRLCEIDPTPPVADLASCAEGAAVFTRITSSDPDITTWYFAPVVAEFDELGEVVRVVPLGGQAARNDGA